MTKLVRDIDQQPDTTVVTVRQMVSADEKRWDEYVFKNPNSVFFHRSGWARLVARVYGYKSYNLIAEQGGNIVGLVPLVFVKSPIAGRALISSGFSVGGGILADNQIIADTLASKAGELGREMGVSYVEVRSEDALFEDWHTKETTYAGFIKPIPETQEEILLAVPRKRRAEIRKSLKLQDAGKLHIIEEQGIDRFYKLYASALRDLGTPVFPKKFIDTLISIFPNETTVLTVEYEGRAVASLVSFYHHDRVMPYYVGSLPEARMLRAADYLYWEQMLRATQRGATQFDFGRSKFNAGSFGYKKTWGIEPKPLQYQYKLIGSDTIPDVNPNNPKYALAIKIWRKLPVPITIFGGAVLARHFA